jgi:hypothetical protein
MSARTGRVESFEVEAPGPCRASRRAGALRALAAALLAPALGAQTVASQPLLHVSIPHPSVSGTPQAGATFGWSMTMGDLDGSAGDELVIASIKEDVNVGGTTYTDLGAAYAYSGTSLSAWNSYFPSPGQDDVSAGQLFMSFGVVRTGAVPWVFVGGAFRDVTYNCPPSSPAPGAGEIALVNFNNGGVGYSYPPSEPSGSCPPAVAQFGHGSAVGDVNGDGVDDLVVGAPGSDGGAGRVYVLYGGTTFPSGWVAFARSGAGAENFGASVAVVDLDADANDTDDAIVVGAWERLLSGGAGPGHAYAFRTADIAALSNTTVHYLTTGYQTLSEPSGAANGNAFGWVVYEVGDVGGPSGALDGHDDVAIHAEATSQGGTAGVGSLTVFWGKSPVASPVSVLDTTNAAFLQIPSGSTPSQGERFGRGAAVVDWEGTSPAGIKKGLLVGSPDAHVSHGGNTYLNAGRVFLFYVPVTSGSGNAFATELLEPDPSVTNGYSPLPRRGSRFGGWIVSGEFDASLTGQQFVVSARERGEGSAAGVGRVYAFKRN